jgi:Fe-S-cluster-containing hydrogenase component 2
MTIKPQISSKTAGSNGSDGKRLNITGLVIACSDSPVATGVSEMEVEGDGWRFQLIDGLCGNSDAIDDAVADENIDRLVVALCKGGYSKTEVLTRSRRAGIETFGTQIVEIPASADDHVNKAVSITAVRGAIARSEAFVSADPANIKTSFSGNNGKMTRRALFTIPPIEYRPVPTIDRLTCIAGSGCNQCEKACPHGAIKNVAGAIKVDVAACKSCGICVAACPQLSVEFPGYSPSEIESHVEAVLTNQDARSSASDVVFTCSKSENLPAGDWQFVPVACAAMVPASALLSTIAAGARSVGILRCVEQCAQQSGEKISGRIDYAKSVLERTGQNPDRVMNLPSADSGEVIISPTVSDAVSIIPSRIEFFGRTAASSSIMALNGPASVPLEPFVHPHSPIGIPVINSDGCTMCGTCSVVCPTGALTQNSSEGWVELLLDAAKCIACSECVAGCPEVANGAIELELRTDVAALSVGPVILNSDQTVACSRCETTFTSQLTLKRLEQLLGDLYTHELYGTLCPECRTLG